MPNFILDNIISETRKMNYFNLALHASALLVLLHDAQGNSSKYNVTTLLVVFDLVTNAADQKLAI